MLLGLTSTWDKTLESESLQPQPLLALHNHFRLYLPPECECDLKGTLSGVGHCQQVRTHFYAPPMLVIRLANPDSPETIMVSRVLSRKVGSAAASRTCVGGPAAPAGTATSSCNQRNTLAVKVRRCSTCLNRKVAPIWYLQNKIKNPSWAGNTVENVQNPQCV